MRASRTPHYSYFALLSSLLFAAAGCSGSQSDRTVRVSQAPAQPGGPAAAVPARLAGGSTENQAGGETSSLAAGSATASIDDSGDVVRQASQTESLGMIGSEGDVDQSQLMAAFQHADPEVRAIAERQYQATLARAQSNKPQAEQPTQPPAGSARPSGPAASQQTMVAANDAVSDRGVPTLPGSAQRVADAQPEVDELSGTDADSGTKSRAKAGDIEPSLDASQTDAPAARTASLSRTAESSDASTSMENDIDSAQQSNSEEQSNADSDAADESEPATFEQQLATLDETRLFEALIARYAEGKEEESEAVGLRRRINHRLLLTMSGRVDEAVEPLDGLTSSEQEYLRHQILALWTAIDPQGHPVSQRRWTTALPHLREATSYLAAATGKLDVRSLAFCTEVVSFGRVKPFEVNRFTAGQEVILYSEIDCFAAERLSDGYETHFSGSFEIFDASGKRVADKVLPSDRQSGKNYRRDYFIAYRMHLPSHLDPGNYRMELTIEDLKGKKYGSSSIAFDIEGSGRAE